MKKRFFLITLLCLIPFDINLMNHIDFLNLPSHPLILSNMNDIHLSNSYMAGDYIGLSKSVWNDTLTGTNITVAILDTGIYANHSVFTNNGIFNWSQRIIKFFDIIENKSLLPYDDNGHGTWAASIIGGNSSEYTGVAPNIRFVILKIFDNSGETNSSTFIQAINWILAHKDIYDIKIVSMSFGAKPEPNNLDDISRLQEATAKLVDEGILVVAAAGNDGNPNIPYGDKTINAPASEKKALAIGGVDYLGNMYPYSGKGPTFEGIIKPDVCAPAISIYGAGKDNPNQYSFRTGTSGATPFVTGLAALMLEKLPELNPLQIKNIISITSFRTINPLIIKDNIQGWGVVQGYAALDALNHPILLNSSSDFLVNLNENKSVHCISISLHPNHYYFELERLNSTLAEMYLFSKDPDIYGEPILLSHTINNFVPNDIKKRMGIDNAKFNDFYLVIKLTEKARGDFIIRMVIEYRNLIFAGFLGINIVVLVYIIILSKKFKRIIVNTI